MTQLTGILFRTRGYLKIQRNSPKLFLATTIIFSIYFSERERERTRTMSRGGTEREGDRGSEADFVLTDEGRGAS